MNKVSTIIVTYNGEKWIRKCLDSLLKSSVPTGIIIVDNNSSDNTVKIIEKEYASLKLIRNSKNLGFGKANNQGIRIALENDSDFYFLLNQDAWVEEKTIEKLMEMSKKHQEYGILSPLHINPASMELDEKFAGYIHSDPADSFITEVIADKSLNIYSTGFINAACWMLTRSAIMKNGGFDPLFFHYGEDLDYCNRLHRKNLLTGYCSGVRVFHVRDYQPKKISGIKKYFLIKYPQILNEVKSNVGTGSELTGYIITYLKNGMKLIFRTKLVEGIAILKISLKLTTKFDTIIEHIRSETENRPHYL